MYILIAHCTNGVEYPDLVAKKKKTIVNHLKELGYYYSKVYEMWIHRDTKKMDGKVLIDYTIEEIEELK